MLSFISSSRPKFPSSRLTSPPPFSGSPGSHPSLQSPATFPGDSKDHRATAMQRVGISRFALSALRGGGGTHSGAHLICMYVYIYIYIHTYTYIYIYMYTCIINSYIYTSVCVYVCMYVCMYIYIYIYIYIILLVIIICLVQLLPFRIAERADPCRPKRPSATTGGSRRRGPQYY